MSDALLLILSLAVPSGGAVLIGLAGRHANLREAISFATAAALLAVVLALLSRTLGGARPSVQLVETLPGIPLMLAIEPLGMMFATLASGLWIVNTLYSVGYMRAGHQEHQTRFYICFAIAIASTVGIAFAGNLFTLFVFYEILTLSTYPLVTHAGTQDAVRAGRVYLGMLLATSFLLLLGAIIWTWLAAGSMSFQPGGILAGKLSPGAVGLLLALYAFGIGKAALMPLHAWLPAAMVAPTPVSALLHAVAVVKAGVFSVVKVVVYVFGLEFLANTAPAQWLLYVAGTSLVLASVIALRQDNLKRRLAYSTVSQLAYVVMAVAMFTPLALTGAVLHIAAHALGKITLFFAAGSIHTAAHKTEISQLDGIGRRMPWTMGAFAIGALSMIGVPPTAGFLGKWFMLLAAMQSGAVFAVACIVVSTALNAAYYLPIVYRAFFRPPPAEPPQAGGDGHGHAQGEAPWPIVVALSITAAGTLALFLLPGLPLTLARMMGGG